MKKIILFIFLSLFLLTYLIGFSQRNYETVIFKSKDKLEITANLYIKNEPKIPFIILFHQAVWHRGEYRELASKLSKLVFGMAIDQRSVEEINGITNKTYKFLKNDINTVFSSASSEYRIGEPANYITQSSNNTQIPVFITSFKTKKKNWWSINETIFSENKHYFSSLVNRFRVLWEKFPKHKEYCNIVIFKNLEIISDEDQNT